MPMVPCYSPTTVHQSNHPINHRTRLQAKPNQPPTTISIAGCCCSLTTRRRQSPLLLQHPSILNTAIQRLPSSDILPALLHKQVKPWLEHQWETSISSIQFPHPQWWRRARSVLQSTMAIHSGAHTPLGGKLPNKSLQ